MRLLALKRGEDWTPVPPELNLGAEILILAEAPGEMEVEELRPLIGPSGKEIEGALRRVGLKRNQVSWSNALLCRPENNNMARVHHAIKKANKKRAKEGRPQWEAPEHYCRPRLLRELREHPNVLALGGIAVGAITESGRASILALRGGPIDLTLAPNGNVTPAGEHPVAGGTHLRVMPTVHPAFVLRKRRWRGPFRADIAKALRWFKAGELTWAEPAVTINPTYDVLKAYLYDPKAHFHTWDLETTKDDPLRAKIRCIGFGLETTAMVVMLAGIADTDERPVRFYTDGEQERILRLIKRWLTDVTRPKVGHNVNAFDSCAVESSWGITPVRQTDTIIVHKLCASELPHSLGFVGSLYTDVGAWKTDHTATTTQSDEELALYCGTDCVVNWRILPPLMREMKERKQDHLLKFDMRLQDIGRGMHTMGMYVDQKERMRLEAMFVKEAAEWEAICLEAAGRSKMNLNSFQQVAELLYEKSGWNLEPAGYTPMGDPTTNDDVLRAHFLDKALTRQQREFMNALRRFRRCKKYLGTYIKKLAPSTDRIEGIWNQWDDDLDDETKEAMGNEWTPGRVLSDGRVHPHYSAHVTTSGRYSSSGPNCFDGETEILTRTGWTRFDMLEDGVEVAQYELDGKITFVQPTAYFREHFTGTMHHVQNQHIDLNMTPGHRCLLKSRKGKFAVHRGDAYPEDHLQYNAGKYVGGDLALGADLIGLLCMVQADGSWLPTKHAQIDVSFTRQRKIERLTDILARLRGTPYEVDARETGGEGTKWRRALTGPGIDLAMAYLGRAKQFGPWILDLTAEDLRTFAEEVFQWDGGYTRQNNYSSSDKVNAEWVQTAHTLIGNRAHLRPYDAPQLTKINWQVDIVRRDYSMTTNAERSTTEHDGLVYCVSVPSSYIVVRRNGKVSVTGQSQNFPRRLRSMITGGAGMVIVGADMAQLELRFAAALWNCPRYIRVFLEGRDAHAETALMLYGDEFANATGKDRERIRDFSKRFSYAVIYGALDPTVHDVITSVENDDGELIYAGVSLRETRLARKNWLAANPEIEIGWESTVVQWRKDGFLTEPITGRRRDFLDGEDFNEIVNFKCQAGGSAIVHKGTFNVIDQIPFGKWGHGTGLINEGHDALYVECPEAEGKAVEKTVVECMTFHEMGMPFPADAKTAKRWGKPVISKPVRRMDIDEEGNVVWRQAV